MLHQPIRTLVFPSMLLIGIATPTVLYHATQAVHLPSFSGHDFKERTLSRPHDDFIFEFDHIVGELMKTLDELAVSDNTLVIVTGNNALVVTGVAHIRRDHNHDPVRQLRGVKRNNREGRHCHRVPVVVRWRVKIEPGSTSIQIAPQSFAASLLRCEESGNSMRPVDISDS